MSENKKIRLGFIGVANQGTLNMKEFFKEDEISRIVAICDADQKHIDKTKALVDEHYGDDACLTFRDFRDLNRCAEVDAVVITTPDHWHALQAIDAARCGKDVYLEKPLSLTIAEGRRISDVVRETGIVLQTGTQQRSHQAYRKACELVRNGYLGEIRKINVGLPPNNKTCEPTWEPMPIPENLDYEMWLGPAPAAEYHEQRCHYQFRFISDYSGGQVTNFGAHHLDVVQWALGMDDAGPVKVRGKGVFPESGLFTTATNINFTLEYPGGIEVEVKTGGSDVEFVGTKGRLKVMRWRYEAEPKSLENITLSQDDVHLYRSGNHYRNFLECILTREQPVATAETGHRSATCCHLGNIAMILGRELRWDPTSERFLDDDEANTMLSREYRGDWSLD